MKKENAKKSLRGRFLLQLVQNRLEVLVLAAYSCSNFSKVFTTIVTIVGISHFFLLQFQTKLLQFAKFRET